MYRSECLAVDRKIKQSLSVAKIKMVKRMSGVTIENKIKNKYIRGSRYRTIELASIVDKMQKNRLRWLGHVFRMKETDSGSKILDW